jgi:hypothetical protein
MGHSGLSSPHESYDDDLLIGHDLLRQNPSSSLIEADPLILPHFRLGWEKTSPQKMTRGWRKIKGD